MRTLSSLGVGLSLVFGCLLMALVAEIYYLFWWRRRKPNSGVAECEEDASSAGGELFFFFFFLCWGKKPTFLRSTRGGLIRREHSAAARPAEGGEGAALPDDRVDAELVELHNLSAPARFLFTIKEETKEDMESEDGWSRGDDSRKSSGRMASDVLLLSAETTFFTPLSSPPSFFTPPLTPMGGVTSRGFSSLSEHPSREGRAAGSGSSPPPKFKFLKDAEEKLYRKTLLEEAIRAHRNGGAPAVEETPPPLASAAAAAAAAAASSSSTVGSCSSSEEDGSFITIVIGRSQERGRHQHHSSSSQVIPLPSSPAQGKT